MATIGSSSLFTAGSATQAFTCPSGTTVLLVFASDSDSDPTGVTYNGTSMTRVGRALATDTSNVSAWHLYNPPTGASHNIVLSGAGFGSVLGAVPISDADAVVDFAVLDNQLAATLTTGSFTTSAGGVAVMLSIGMDFDGPFVAYGGGESALASPVAAFSRQWALSGKDTAGTSTTMSHQWTGGAFRSCAIAVSVSTAATAPPFRSYYDNL